MVKSEFSHSVTHYFHAFYYIVMFISYFIMEHPSWFYLVTALNEEVRRRWVHPHFVSEEIETYRNEVSCS